jgi:hypothetical protein
MARITEPLYPYTDLLAYAEKHKLDTWNGTIARLQKSRFFDSLSDRGGRARIELDELEDEKDLVLREIYRGFLEQEGLTGLAFIDE